MPRILVNGVIWNKTQDTILKVGVSRYGENQWERILPLLPGKTAKQCKVRWEIGLRQSTKKIEWTSTEDDRLLRLTAIMPAEWQDIASIFGRTAVDCFNRYDYLTNQMQSQDEEDDEEVLDPKKVVPGRVYHNPNGKLTRADRDYILEDGLEARLSVARARLAHSQARKAKLMAREKRLAVARRFAYVRSQRERIKAQIRFAEMHKRISTVDSEDLSESQSPSCFYYSSAGRVDPLTEVFFEMQQQDSNTELKASKEEINRLNEQRLKRRHESDNFVSKFLGEDETSPKRKVVVLREPGIASDDLQQIVELRRHFESTGCIASSDQSSNFCEDKGSSDFTEVGNLQKNNNFSA